MKHMQLVQVRAEPTAEQVRFVVERMRLEDRAEAEYWRATDGEVERMFTSHRGRTYLFFYRQRPAFLWGLRPRGPDVVALIGLGTDDTTRIMPYATRWGRTWLRGFFATDPTNAIVADVPNFSIHSLSWLRKIGMRDFHNNGDCTQLVYTREDQRKRNVFFIDTKLHTDSHAGPVQNIDGSPEGNRG